MITDLIIKNYQSHKNTHLKFTKGFNVIAGISHHGKSAISRALKWAVHNTPRGFGFKSHFSTSKDNTSVKIIKDSEIFIQRSRGKALNNYTYGTIDGVKNQPLSALNTAVPDEISKLLNMSSINICSQSDRYFLLEESGGKIAKKLNKITGLSDIDVMLTNATKLIDKANADSKYEKGTIQKLNEDIKEFKNVDVMANRIKSLVKTSEEFETLHTRINNLDDLLKNIETTKEDIEEAKKPLKYKKQLKNVKNLIDDYKYVRNRKNVLNNLLVSISDTNNKIRKYKKQIQKNDLTIIKENIEKWKSINIKANNLDNLLIEYYQNKKQQKELKESLKDLKNQRKEFMDKQKICPLCKTNLQEKCNEKTQVTN
jgi:DNA repair ATPase RecN